MSHRASVLIAAAGSSTRMGFPKALLPKHKQTYAYYLAHKFYRARINNILITLPDFLLNKSYIRAPLESIGARIIKNEFSQHGYAGSIKSGLLHVAPSCSGIFIAPIDCLISEALIKAVININFSHQDKAVIIIPYCRGSPGHPVFVSHKLFTKLSNCHSYGGLNNFIRKHKELVVKIAFEDAQILTNFNTFDCFSD